MTRRFLADVKADINSSMADNNTGAITPSIIRANLFDLIDSTIQAEAVIGSTGPTAGIVLDGTFAVIATAYDQEAGDDGAFLIPAFALGTITGTSTAGFGYTVRGEVTVDAANNEEIDFSIGVNGVATGFIASLVGDGARNHSVGVEFFDRAAASSAVYTLMARAADGSATIDIQAVVLRLIVLPTNSP